MRLQATWLTLLLGISFAITGCARDERPNIVLVTLDTTRADRLGAYGDENARTPVLDALAARGALFEHAYSPVPLTLPSHTTLMTGLSASTHGVHDNTRFIVPDSLETLAERFQASGYTTGAFVSAFVLDSSFGLDQGFEVYNDDTHAKEDPLSLMVPQRPGGETTDDALAWLTQERKEPFFLWTHYYDPHAPRTPHLPFADEIDDSYSAAIAYMDSQLGRLLEGVEGSAAGRETVIIVVADHGESLGDHREPTHGIVAYDSTLRVPLIAVGSGFAPGTRSQHFVRTEDVAPSLLTAAGLTPQEGTEGTPLQSTLTEPSPDERIAPFESLGPAFALGWAPLAGVRTSRWKYTAEPNPAELYDILADPGETQNRIAEQPEIVERLAARYAQIKPVRKSEAERHVLDPAVEAQLAALGYMSAPQQFDPGQQPDPRKAVATLGWVRRAKAMCSQEGRLADGIEALTILTNEPSVRAVALRDLAIVYASAGHTSKAIESLHALLALTNTLEIRIRIAHLLLVDGHPEAALAILADVPTPTTGESLALILARGHAQLALGQHEEAEKAALTVLQKEPGKDEALALASRSRAMRGEEQEKAEIKTLQALLENPPAGVQRLPNTRQLLAALLRRDDLDRDAAQVLEAANPPSAENLRMLADIALDHGDEAKAATLYESLLQRVPVADDVRRQLAELYDSLGRTEESLALYNALIAVSPEDATLWVDRGTTHFRLRHLPKAEQDFRTAISLDDTLPEAHLDLGLVSLAAGRDKEAETELIRALELRPDFAKAHFHLARLYQRDGDPRAAHHAERATQLSAQTVGATQQVPPPESRTDRATSPAPSKDTPSPPPAEGT